MFVSNNVVKGILNNKNNAKNAIYRIAHYALRKTFVKNARLISTLSQISV